MNLNRIAILSAFAIGLALSSCVSGDDTANPGDGSASSSSVASVNERPLAGEGEFCGGIAAFRCEPGLTCVLDGTYPDAGGTCERP